MVSVYNKLHGLETRTSAELVRYRARECAPLIAQMEGERAPWLEGYRVTMVDGHCLEASAHRLKDLREATGRALPGTSLVVYAPASGLVTDVCPGEDGHAQARARLGAVLATVAAAALWIAARHFCTRTFLGAMATRGGFFVLRHHPGGPCEIVSPLRSDDRTPTGHLAQQRVWGVDEHGAKHVWRRLRLTWEHPTRPGAPLLHLLPNLPRQRSAPRVAQLARHRWTWETACHQ
jgi:hypothetical protein